MLRRGLKESKESLRLWNCVVVDYLFGYPIASYPCMQGRLFRRLSQNNWKEPVYGAR